MHGTLGICAALFNYPHYTFTISTQLSYITARCKRNKAGVLAKAQEALGQEVLQWAVARVLALQQERTAYLIPSLVTQAVSKRPAVDDSDFGGPLTFGKPASLPTPTPQAKRSTAEAALDTAQPAASASVAAPSVLPLAVLSASFAAPGLVTAASGVGKASVSV